MQKDELMLKVENVSKVYRLGEIGGTTLRDELQRLKAKVFHKEDPTKKIGARNYNRGEKFKALDNISFEVKKGERIGIIGHNGAGKSTLLKLISRVTGPTDGKIYLNGRVASMLEVGTGFHPELTGRENVYMNGAILGMTKKEIDVKMEDIIEFSEVRQFIDTPVKRYSSGMYVKLAFSVAAHLDSEIMIMDEVLAVGDMAFQNKCLAKMKDVSINNDKTVIYVSHNMSTIRQLCDRVIVLNKGKIEFDGDVEKGISTYIGNKMMQTAENYYLDLPRDSTVTRDVFIKKLTIVNKTNILELGDQLCFTLSFDLLKTLEHLVFRFNFYTIDGVPVATSHFPCHQLKKNTDINKQFRINTSLLSPGSYYLKIVAFEPTFNGSQIRHDEILNAVSFTVSNKNQPYNLNWDNKYWGSVILNDAEELK